MWVRSSEHRFGEAGQGTQPPTWPMHERVRSGSQRRKRSIVEESYFVWSSFKNLCWRNSRWGFLERLAHHKVLCMHFANTKLDFFLLNRHFFPIVLTEKRERQSRGPGRTGCLLLAIKFRSHWHPIQGTLQWKADTPLPTPIQSWGPRAAAFLPQASRLLTPSL